MAKKFLEGLVFGAGFGISFLALSYLVTFLVMPALVSSTFHMSETSVLDGGPGFTPGKASPNFYDLTLEEQINEASVIALVRYEPASDGGVKAVIREFLKKDPDVTIYYNIGDEYPPASYFPREDTEHGDGVIVFFVGSPAEMRLSTSYSGDRIRGLGDIPMELFRQKCSGSDA